MRVTVTADATKFCPYMSEQDWGTLEMTFDVVDGDAPELHQLAKSLEAWSDQARSHEEFTRWVASSTGAVRVVSKWRTAGMDVTCDLSRESDG
jgi:endo-1,4-beta-mannosidase